MIHIHTLESEYVLQEIAWAIEHEKKILTIVHPDYQFPQQGKYEIPENLAAALNHRGIEFWSIINKITSTQAIRIDSESAKHYESAVNELINTLGYSTI